MMARIWLVGSGGAGKSTLAQAISTRLALPHTELDSLYWRPGWQPLDSAEFRAAVAAVVAQPRWVVCGNYSKASELVLARADTVIWLDYPLALIWWRLLKRTLRRAATREDLWDSGNRESWRNAFFSRDSLLLYVLRTHRRRSATFARLMASDEHPNLTWLRFTSPRAAEAWLAALPQR